MNSSGDRIETLRVLKFVAAIGLTLTALATGADRADALTSESGDFVQEVERLKTLAFARDSGLYEAPSAAERAAFSTLAATLPDMRILVPHWRLVSGGHLSVASRPILAPRPSSGEAKSR